MLEMSKHFIKISVLLCFLIMSCENTHTIDIQGHRGCRGLLPENTIEAFTIAIDLGVHTLEMDLAITKDHEVVVSHEPFMNALICLKPSGKEITKTEAKKFNLYQMSYEEIKTFDCGLKFHPNFPNQKKIVAHKPLLSEVIRLSENKNKAIRYNLELKAKPEYDTIYSPEPKEFVSIVIALLKTENVLDKTTLQSFDLRILEEIKKQDSSIQVALLVEEDDSIEAQLSLLSYQPEIISPYFKLLSQEIIQDYQGKGFKIIPWTVNSIDEMQLLIDYKIDGIITDYPDRLVKLLR